MGRFFANLILVGGLSFVAVLIAMLMGMAITSVMYPEAMQERRKQQIDDCRRGFGGTAVLSPRGWLQHCILDANGRQVIINGR